MWSGIEGFYQVSHIPLYVTVSLAFGNFRLFAYKMIG